MKNLEIIEISALDIARLYPHDFTKKEAILTGKRMVDNLIEAGEIDKMEFVASLARLNEVVSSAMSEIRTHIPFEKQKVYGIEFTPVNGGQTVNYAEDPIYQQLKQDLDNRVELLKLAQKQDVIDAYGNDVPKVSTTPRKDSITLKF
jgi:hypothetical protein